MKKTLLIIIALIVTAPSFWLGTSMVLDAFIEPSPHRITSQEAIKYIDRWKNSNKSIANVGSRYVEFDKSAFSEIVIMGETAKVRIYHGLSKDGDYSQVVVGVDKHGDKLADRIQQKSSPCPPVCNDSPLSGDKL